MGITNRFATESYVSDEIYKKVDTIQETKLSPNYDTNVKSVNHRGYCAEAPENTIPAYILSKKKGFSYVECDVSFTADGVAVLLHDDTIDRTSNGSGSIANLTYDQVSQYDFGSWKAAEYAGTKIPTFSEFISACKGLCLHPYIELKNNGAYTQENISGIVSEVKSNGMKGKVTYISFSPTYLEYVKNVDSSARLGYLVSNLSSTAVTTAQNLRSEDNEVFIDAKLANLTNEQIASCIAADIPLEVWTVNNSAEIENMNSYIIGVTSDNLVAGKVLYDKYMSSGAISDVYNVVNILSNVVSSNASITVAKNAEYTTTLSASAGYELSNVQVTMGGVDITSSAYSSGVVSISSVSGHVVITATAVLIGGGEDEPTITIPDGALINLALSSYDGGGTIVNDGSGGSAYNATVSGNPTTIADGLKLNTADNFSVSKELSSNTSWTWFVSARIGEFSTQKYQRIMRGNIDVPSVYWSTNYSQYGVKLTNSATSLSPTEMLNLGMSKEAGGTNTFAFVCNGQTVDLYINGNFFKSEDSNIMSTNNKQPAIIGCGDIGNQSYYFNALDVKAFVVYERALTADEISTLHNATV